MKGRGCNLVLKKIAHNKFFKYIHGIKKVGEKKRKKFNIAISFANEKQDLEKIQTAPYKPKLFISQQLGFHL